MSKTKWDSIRLFFSGDEYFTHVLDGIDKAKSQVLIESYIFHLDSIGFKVIAACEAAVLRGVQVRILVDGVGTFNWLPNLVKICRQKNIPLRVYNPLPVTLDAYLKMSWVVLRQLLSLFRRINKRNHRKIVAIDSEVCFLGSFNISQVHSQEFMEDKVWRDTGVRVQGEEVKKIQTAFFNAWRKARFQTVKLPRLPFRRHRIRQRALNSLLRLNTSTAWRFLLLQDLKRRMRAAQSRILITNAYFLPRNAVLRHLRKAARRGIYVALCLPHKSDVPPVQWASRSLYYRLMKDGVQIYEYEPGMLHAKTMVIDNWATVGSHNLNHRSLHHDLEIEAVIEDDVCIQQLATQFDHDLQKSRKITFEHLGHMGLWDKILARFAYWFRYWL